MILKNYEISKIDIEKHKNFLFYGNNNGLIDQVVKEKFSKNFEGKIFNYEEADILNHKENFFNQILNSSFFENKKLIVITRVTNKLIEIINDILEKNIEDVTIILKAGQLEKKSKLRKLFEDSKKTICIAFYPDTEATLSKLTQEFFQKEKINISQQNINIIINKCNNDRAYLLNELKKISLLTLDKKNLSMSQIMKVVNLTENHSINELVNTCLLKNKKKTINILNENNFGTEDTILILRTFLNKLKKFLKLANIYEENKNLETTIKNARPPIFWKEKDIVKQQLINWTPHKIQNLIFELNNVEVQVKKYNSNSINIVSDFILNSFTEKTNN